MAWDSSEIEYHLTPNGWLPGEAYLMGDTTANHNPVVPEDRVLTIRQFTKQTSGWSPEDVWERVTFSSPDISNGDLKALIEKHKKPFPFYLKPSWWAERVVTAPQPSKSE